MQIGISAYANARKLFVHKKTARSKEEKTIIASKRVVENVEASAMKALESQKLKRTLLAVRKVTYYCRNIFFDPSESLNDYNSFVQLFSRFIGLKNSIGSSQVRAIWSFPAEICNKMRC